MASCLLQKYVILKKELTAEEKNHLEAELKFERSLGNYLSDTPGCPDDLWESIQIKAESKNPKVSYSGVIISFLAAAAAVALIFLSSAPIDKSSVFELSKVSEFTKLSETSTDIKEIEQFLLKNNIKLKIDSDKMSNYSHDLKLLGAYRAKVGDQEVVALLFTCCGEPVKVILMPKESLAVKVMAHHAISGNVVATNTIDDYKIGVIGQHKGSGNLVSMLY